MPAWQGVRAQETEMQIPPLFRRGGFSQGDSAGEGEIGVAQGDLGGVHQGVQVAEF